MKQSFKYKEDSYLNCENIELLSSLNIPTTNAEIILKTLTLCSPKFESKSTCMYVVFYFIFLLNMFFNIENVLLKLLISIFIIANIFFYVKLRIINSYMSFKKILSYLSISYLNGFVANRNMKFKSSFFGCYIYLEECMSTKDKKDIKKNEESENRKNINMKNIVEDNDNDIDNNRNNKIGVDCIDNSIVNVNSTSFNSNDKKILKEIDSLILKAFINDSFEEHSGDYINVNNNENNKELQLIGSKKNKSQNNQALVISSTSHYSNLHNNMMNNKIDQNSLYSKQSNNNNNSGITNITNINSINKKLLLNESKDTKSINIMLSQNKNSLFNENTVSVISPEIKKKFYDNRNNIVCSVLNLENLDNINNNIILSNKNNSLQLSNDNNNKNNNFLILEKAIYLIKSK